MVKARLVAGEYAIDLFLPHPPRAGEFVLTPDGQFRIRSIYYDARAEVPALVILEADLGT